ncbi:MAG TPA: hypothetical protein VMU81_20095 [Acetobacteraceae bacterium]|jgi:hypothetical protein|nr:hypothetical protein [Acetobacteraceae bacterium]
MKLPDRRSGNGETISATLDSILTACTVVLLLASLGGLAALISGLHVGLRVGDILVFKPSTEIVGGLPANATFSDAGSRPAGAPVVCTLDPEVMAHGGGSLAVESKSLVKPIYRVHWAGGQTAKGGSSCGTSANLTISRMDLQSLVNAIGGFSLNSRGNVI